MASTLSLPLDGAGPEATMREPRKRTSTMSSVAHSVHSVTHTAQNAAKELLHKDPPPGFFAATAEAASHGPTINEIRLGSYGNEGWQATPDGRSSQASSMSRGRPDLNDPRDSPVLVRSASGGLNACTFPALVEETSYVSNEFVAGHAITPSPLYEEPEDLVIARRSKEKASSSISQADYGKAMHLAEDPLRAYSSGYIPPPIVPWTTSALIGFKAFWRWSLTPFGFLVTIYGLNVVAWGGMLFILLCNASPAMCWAPVHVQGTEKHYSPAAALALDSEYPHHYDCDDINSPRRIWLEIDSQILNALFCVTGFGLAPWRFRDLWYLLSWRLTSEQRAGRDKKLHGLRVLAGIYKNWFRLPGSETLDIHGSREHDRPLHSTKDSISSDRDLESGLSEVSDIRLPLPISKRPDHPVTGVRAPSTTLWKLDFFIWSQVGNTLFQVVLCGLMWGMSRYDRPSWATGVFIALGCVIAGLGGLVSFLEGKKVKKVEGAKPDEATQSTSDDQIEEKDDVALSETGTEREGMRLRNEAKGG